MAELVDCIQANLDQAIAADADVGSLAPDVMALASQVEQQVAQYGAGAVDQTIAAMSPPAEVVDLFYGLLGGCPVDQPLHALAPSLGASVPTGPLPGRLDLGRIDPFAGVGDEVVGPTEPMFDSLALMPTPGLGMVMESDEDLGRMSGGLLPGQAGAGTSSQSVMHWRSAEVVAREWPLDHGEAISAEGGDLPRLPGLPSPIVAGPPGLAAFAPAPVLGPALLLGPFGEGFLLLVWFELLKKWLNSGDPELRRLAYTILVLFWPIEAIEEAARRWGEKLDPDAFDLWTKAYNQVRERIEQINKVLGCADDTALLASIVTLNDWLTFNLRLKDWLAKHGPGTKEQQAKLAKLRAKVDAKIKPKKKADSLVRMTSATMWNIWNYIKLQKEMLSKEKDAEAIKAYETKIANSMKAFEAASAAHENAKTTKEAVYQVSDWWEAKGK